MDLPVTMEHPDTPRNGERPRPAGLRVLVVEDDLIAAESLGLLLRLWGHEPRVTLDGLTALAAAQERLPDVALLDIGLPGTLDGYEVARRLGQLPGQKHPLLIALSGRSEEGDCLRSERAGFHLHLVKPIDSRELRGLLSRFSEVLGN